MDVVDFHAQFFKILQIRVFSTSKTDFYKKIVLKALRDSQADKNESINFVNCVIDASKVILKPDKGKTKEERTVAFADDESEARDCGGDRKTEWTEDELTTHTVMFLNSRK